MCMGDAFLTLLTQAGCSFILPLSRTPYRIGSVCLFSECSNDIYQTCSTSINILTHSSSMNTLDGCALYLLCSNCSSKSQTV